MSLDRHPLASETQTIADSVQSYSKVDVMAKVAHDRVKKMTPQPAPGTTTVNEARSSFYVTNERTRMLLHRITAPLPAARATER